MCVEDPFSQIQSQLYAINIPCIMDFLPFPHCPYCRGIGCSFFETCLWDLSQKVFSSYFYNFVNINHHDHTMQNLFDKFNCFSDLLNMYEYCRLVDTQIFSHNKSPPTNGDTHRMALLWPSSLMDELLVSNSWSLVMWYNWIINRVT